MTDPEPWFRDGLAFACTRCGHCCTGRPGYVWVGLDEMVRLAEHQGESLDGFTAAHVRQVGDRYSLVERPDGDCIFWDREAGCTVYEARPEQCRSWPFWPANLAAPAAWERAGSGCPGIGRGPVVPMPAIEAASIRSGL